MSTKLKLLSTSPSLYNNAKSFSDAGWPDSEMCSKMEEGFATLP